MKLSPKAIQKMLYKNQIRYHKPYKKPLIERHYAINYIEKHTHQTREEIEKEVDFIFFSFSSERKKGKE